MVDAREKASDIHLQDIGVATGQVGISVHGLVGAASQNAGVGSGDEAFFEKRLNDAAKRMLNHPIPKRSRCDESRLGKGDSEGAVARPLLRPEGIRGGIRGGNQGGSSNENR
jgi:hypothetical protein